MTQSADPKVGSPALTRRLARENLAMGPRLAQLEFQMLSKELASKDLFELKLDFPETKKVAQLDIPNLAHHPMAGRAPILNVTVGKTAWVQNPEELPVIGIFVEDRNGEDIRASLAVLLRRHYIEPFARLLFLCTSMRPIPFLGRYEFTYEYVSDQEPIALAQRLKLRYGMEQIRDLVTGRPIWRGTTPSVNESSENLT